MPSTRSDPRMIRLGQILTYGIPLGPFEDLALVFYVSSSDQGKLHGDANCGMLRSASAIHARETELRHAVGDLCGHCAWPVPSDHPVVDFIGAITAVADLKTWIATTSGPDSRATANEAATAPDKRVEDSGHATRLRALREHHRRHWRRLHTSMLGSHAATLAYPCLRLWAEPLQSALAEAIEYQRQELAALLHPDVLLEAAYAAALPAPELEAGADFAGLGVDASRVLQRAWSQWQHTAATGWSAVEESRSAATAVLYDAFGRRRKGRAEALEALDCLVADWTAQARAQAIQHRTGPRQPVTVTIPPVARDALTGAEQDPLTLWEAGVIATHQVSARWPAGSIDLLLPQPIAAQLIRSAESIRRPDRPERAVGLAPGNGIADEREARSGW